MGHRLGVSILSLNADGAHRVSLAILAQLAVSILRATPENHP